MTASTENGSDSVVINPISHLRGELRLPGDKSISHRAAMIAALARGESTFRNFSTARDCEATLACLRSLGVEISKRDSTVVVRGVGITGLQKPDEVLNAQNSGTTMRLLAGMLAGQPFSSTITGDESLLKRPMLRVAEPLRLMGATVNLSANNSGPLQIVGRHPLQPIDYEPTIASAQLKSAVLLAALAGNTNATVDEPTKTRDHTERLLQEFGASVKRDNKRISLQSDELKKTVDAKIAGDISSAAFVIAAAIALPGSDLLIRDVGLNPTRTAFVAKLTELGANIEISEQRVENSEPVGTLHVCGVPLKNKLPIVVAAKDVSSLIDELPLLAFLAASIGCSMDLHDAGELRVKESDRISATVDNLTRMGAEIIEREDGWLLEPGSKLRGTQLQSFGDHRIAMSCAVAALSADGSSIIEGGRSAVAVSFPEFWELLQSVSE